jgi:hypothetical protein
MNCDDYQSIAERAPDISDEDRFMALLHLAGDVICEACRDRQTAFREVQNRRLVELARRGK